LMTMRLLLEGRVYRRGRIVEAKVLVENGWIVRVSRSISEEVDRRIRLREGEVALPAPIDLHVHCRDPHPDYDFDFRTETLRLLLGGVATAVDMPNTRPAPVDAETFREKERRARRRALIEVIVSGAVRDKGNVRELVSAGAPVLGEAFLAPSTDAPVIEPSEVPGILRAAGDAPVLFHAELGELVSEDGASDLLDHHLNRPPEAEATAVGLLAGAVSAVGGRAHVCHATLPESVDLARRAGMTVEVTPHHLFFDTLRVDARDPTLKVNPPIRGRRQRLGLLERVRRGRVDVLATDHAPHPRVDRFEEAPSGVSSGGLLLPAALTLHRRYGVSLRRAVDMITRNPARILGREDLGEVAPGRRARIAVVETREFRVSAERLMEEDRKFPYDGLRMYGRPTRLILEDRVYDLEESRRVGEPVLVEGG